MTLLGQADLLLITIVVFCTTEPLADSKILPYTRTVPYRFLTVAVSLATRGLVISLTAIFVIHKTNLAWLR